MNGWNHDEPECFLGRRRAFDAVKAEIEKLGFAISGSFGIRDVVPCVGTTYCPKAVTKTRNMCDLLVDLVKQPKFDAIKDKVIINTTGCPNSCSPYRIADIGLCGTRESAKKRFGRRA